MRNHPPVAYRRWQATLILTLFFVSVAGAAGIGWWYARESPPHQGPIVLITIDGLPVSSLSAYGAPASEMPAIAALAVDAVVFDRAYAHSPETLPAHASILTGQLPPEHGVRDDAGFALTSDARTLSELLRGRGFGTGAAVSSFLLRRDTGVAQGFSFFDAELPETPTNSSPILERDGGLTAAAAERWLREQNGQRFFLFLQVPAPSADAAVERLVQVLKERRLYDKATVVLVGGRGDSGGGTSLEEATLRIPLIVKQPNRDGAGRRIASPVQQIDLLPTLLDLVRAPVPSGLRGRSLKPVLEDGEGRIPAQPIYSESLTAFFRFGGHPIFAMATDRHRFVRGVESTLVQIGPADEPTVATDPTSALSIALDRLLKGTTLPSPAPSSATDEDRLALLGYLGGMGSSPTIIGAISQEQQSTLVEAHREAARLVGEKKLIAAIRALQAIVREHPTLPSVHYQIGALMARTGRVDEAISAFREAQRLQPESIDASIALASALMRAGRLSEALEQADLAVARTANTSARDQAAAHEIAARVALERRDTDAASGHAQAAQKAEPTRPLPQFVTGRLLYEEGRYEDAATAFSEAEQTLRAEATSLADLHFYLGESLTQLDRYPEAEEHFREEIRAFPRSVHAYASLAMLYRAGHRDQAIEDVLDELLEAVPTPEGYAVATRLWTILGDRPRADALRSDARTRFRGDQSLALGAGGRR